MTADAAYADHTLRAPSYGVARTRARVGRTRTADQSGLQSARVFSTGTRSQQVLRRSAVPRLDAIELTAALLVRESVNNRARVFECRAPVLPAPSKRPRRSQRSRNNVLLFSALCWRCAAATVGLTRHPRLHAVAWEAYAFVADMIVVLSTAFVAVVVLAAAVLIGAPPV